MQNKAPKYYILKNTIIDKIDSEEFSVDKPIPSERELMETYQVSRITVRKAIDELVNEGYLYRIQGKGTYVKSDDGGSDLISMTSCTEDVIRLGMKPSKKVVMADVTKPDGKRKKILELSENDNIYVMGRILYADQEPLNYTVTYLPEKIFPRLDKHSFDVESLYNVIENEYGIKITKARRTMEAVLVRDDIAELLELEEASPIILFRCVTFGIVNGKEIPIETFKCYYRTDKFKFYIDQIR